MMKKKEDDTSKKVIIAIIIVLAVVLIVNNVNLTGEIVQNNCEANSGYRCVDVINDDPGYSCSLTDEIWENNYYLDSSCGYPTFFACCKSEEEQVIPAESVCGDGKCMSWIGENCNNCWDDCGCTDGGCCSTGGCMDNKHCIGENICNNGEWILHCGDGFYQPSYPCYETQENCPQDYGIQYPDEPGVITEVDRCSELDIEVKEKIGEIQRVEIPDLQDYYNFYDHKIVFREGQKTYLKSFIVVPDAELDSEKVLRKGSILHVQTISPNIKLFFRARVLGDKQSDPVDRIIGGEGYNARNFQGEGETFISIGGVTYYILYGEDSIDRGEVENIPWVKLTWGTNADYGIVGDELTTYENCQRLSAAKTLVPRTLDFEEEECTDDDVTPEFPDGKNLFV